MGFDRLALLDINRHCLDRAAQRLARLNPTLNQVNLLAPIELDLAPFSSVGLTYVLHCLPGSMSEKLLVTDHLRGPLRDGGTAPNAAARALLALYNSKGVFNNREDDTDALSDGLRWRFDKVDVRQVGLAALFRAS